MGPVEVALILFGVWQLYRRGPSCQRRSRAGIVVESADGDRRAAHVVRRPPAPVHHDGAARRIAGDLQQLVGWRVRVILHARAGCRQQLRLPRRSRTAAGDHRALAVERQEHRQPRQRRHSPGACFGRGAYHVHGFDPFTLRIVFSENRYPLFGTMR